MKCFIEGSAEIILRFQYELASSGAKTVCRLAAELRTIHANMVDLIDQHLQQALDFVHVDFKLGPGIGLWLVIEEFTN